MLPEIDFLKSDSFHSVITVILLSSTKKTTTSKLGNAELKYQRENHTARGLS
jgi:hypothetical protein